MPSLRQHAFGFLVFVSLAVFFAITGVLKGSVSVPQKPEEVRGEIGVEHSLPLDMEVKISRKRDKGIAEIIFGGEENVYLSAPEEWKRREVFRVQIDSVKGERTDFGFIRWGITRGGGISFEIPKYPDSMYLHNPSAELIKAKVTMVDLDSGTASVDVKLIKESPVRLW